MRCQMDERDHFGRGQWDATVSRDTGDLQTTIAYFRQADDLLSLVGSDVSEDSRHLDHFHAGRYTAV